METFATGTHWAYLDPERGAGIVVAPCPSGDLKMGGPESMHSADWNSLARQLADTGWTFLEDKWQDVAVIARFPDGSKVHALYPAHVADSAEAHTDAEDQAYALALAQLVATAGEKTSDLGN